MLFIAKYQLLHLMLVTYCFISHMNFINVNVNNTKQRFAILKLNTFGLVNNAKKNK